MCFACALLCACVVLFWGSGSGRDQLRPGPPRFAFFSLFPTTVFLNNSSLKGNPVAGHDGRVEHESDGSVSASRGRGPSSCRCGALLGAACAVLCCVVLDPPGWRDQRVTNDRRRNKSSSRHCSDYVSAHCTCVRMSWRLGDSTTRVAGWPKFGFGAPTWVWISTREGSCSKPGGSNEKRPSSSAPFFSLLLPVCLDWVQGCPVPGLSY